MKKITFVVTTIAAALLSACGGGSTVPGATTPPPPVVVTPPPPTVTPPNLQTTVPAPTYAAGSPQLQAFNEINGVRQAVGLGLLAQNTQLDTAAFNHASFIATNINNNSAVFSHTEIATLPGFTGLNPSDRTTFTGYGSQAGEELTLDVPPINGVVQPSPVMGLLNSVYHRAGLLDQCYRDVGIGEATQINQYGFPFTPFVIELGSKNGCQTNASNFVLHYPLTGQTNVPLFAGGEAPNPYPNLPLLNGSADTSTISSPISVASANGTTLTLTSIAVTEQNSSVQIPMNVITAQNDINPALARSNWLYFYGNSPFKPKTTYNVNFVGAVNGVTINQNWSFITQ